MRNITFIEKSWTLMKLIKYSKKTNFDKYLIFENRDIYTEFSFKAIIVIIIHTKSI